MFHYFSPMAISQIEVSNLIKTYSSRAEELTVLRSISFKIARGEVVCFLGTSGSGKTTTLNLLAGIDKPTAGKIYYGGKDIHEWSTDQLFEYRLKEIGFIFQEFYLLEHLSALENVMVPIILDGESEEVAQDLALELLNQVGLGGRALNLPQELSSGEKQRVCVARAIVNNPSVLIADEPTGTLDSKTGGEIMSLLLRLAKKNKMAMIYTTHDPYFTKLASKIIVLQKGKIIEHSPDDFEDIGYDKSRFEFLFKGEKDE